MYWIQDFRHLCYCRKAKSIGVSGLGCEGERNCARSSPSCECGEIEQTHCRGLRLPWTVRTPIPEFLNF